MTKVQKVKYALKKLIREVSTISWLFAKRPGKDFTRQSKLGVEKTITFLLAMEGRSINNELLEYFHCAVNTPTASAFVQCRNKLLPEAMEMLFRRFAESFPSPNTYKGYHLLAVDGTDLQIPTNPNDPESFFNQKTAAKRIICCTLTQCMIL